MLVIDNASFHKQEDIKACIEKTGHILEFLPTYTYSPDLNPIEHKCTQVKSIRKKTHCSIDALFKCHL